MNLMRTKKAALCCGCYDSMYALYSWIYQLCYVAGPGERWRHAHWR